MSDDIVARLKRQSVSRVFASKQLSDGTMIWHPMMLEAADEITRLRAENERLREALKPFADEFRLYKTDFPDHFYISDLGFTFGQLRAASAALEGVTGPKT